MIAHLREETQTIVAALVDLAVTTAYALRVVTPYTINARESHVIIRASASLDLIVKIRYAQEGSHPNLIQMKMRKVSGHK